MKGVILTGMFLAGAGFVAYTWTQSLYRPEPAGNIFGYVRAVDSDMGNISLLVDEAELLSGEEAIQKGMADTGCKREAISDCIPSLNNDFYIRNLDKTAKKYKLADNADISIFAHPGSPVLRKSAPAEFSVEYVKPASMLNQYGFNMTIEDGKIIRLEEQYVP